MTRGIAAHARDHRMHEIRRRIQHQRLPVIGAPIVRTGGGELRFARQHTREQRLPLGLRQEIVDHHQRMADDAGRG
jgi:hypothetical protein